MGLIKDDDSRFCAGRRSITLKVWLGWLLSLLILDAGYEELCLLSQLGGRYLLIGKKCVPQFLPNKFEARERGFPGYFIIETWSILLSLLLCSLL